MNPGSLVKVRKDATIWPTAQVLMGDKGDFRIATQDFIALVFAFIPATGFCGFIANDRIQWCSEFYMEKL